MRSGSGWDKLYSYQLFWMTNYQNWPIPDEANHMSIGPCCLFQGGKPVPTPGYSYQWWDPAKGYHSHKPYQLRVVTNFQQACHIITPSTIYTVEDQDDDYSCMCVRQKSFYTFQKNNLEAQKILDELLLPLFNDTSIEDWRYRASNTCLSSISPLDSPSSLNQKLLPLFPQHNRMDQSYYKKNYLDHEIVTTLQFNPISLPEPLSPRSMVNTVQGLAKKHPKLTLTLKKQMATILCKAAKKVVLSPTKLVGSPVRYMTTLNQDHISN